MSSSGPIAIVAGSGGVIFNNAAQSFVANDAVTLTDSSPADLQSNVTLTGAALIGGTPGVLVDNGSTLSWGTAGATISGPTTVGGTVSGTLAPTPGTYGTLNTAALTLNPTATTQVDISAGSNSVIAVSGAATLGGALAVNVTGTLALNQTFTILTSTFGISGNFLNASSITTASGLYTFAATVSGNTLVLTVTGTASFDVSNGMVTFADPGVSPNITVATAGGNYTISDATISSTSTPTPPIQAGLAAVPTP